MKFLMFLFGCVPIEYKSCSLSKDSSQSSELIENPAQSPPIFPFKSFSKKGCGFFEYSVPVSYTMLILEALTLLSSSKWMV